MIKLTGREVMWDDYLIEKRKGLKIQMHKPEYRSVVFTADAPWEGCTTGYFAIMNEAVGARLYYRGCELNIADDNSAVTHEPNFCLCYTKDGKYFERVQVNKVKYGIFENNNIIFNKTNDNFTVIYDANPVCPQDEKYKALSGTDDRRLMYYKSGDGISFEFVRELVADGMYDSMNVVFWDAKAGCYRLYYRGLHDEQGNDFKWGRGQKGTPIRDIRVKTSVDFVNWSDSKWLYYGENAPDLEMYTNQIRPYYRAPQVLLGIPTRYNDRVNDIRNFAQLPDYSHRAQVTAKWDRSGTAMTDCCLMTSRDGVNFNRCNEAFLTPGPERQGNWYYGDCYTALGMMETKADREGAPNEISVYMGQNYRVDSVELARYALRLDGFFSWHGDFDGASVITKPLSFEGNALSINFATSALGYVRFRVLDENKTEIPGYDSGKLFGDNVDRKVCFDKPLAELAGKTVRIAIDIKDADLYSIKFEVDLLKD